MKFDHSNTHRLLDNLGFTLKQIEDTANEGEGIGALIQDARDRILASPFGFIFGLYVGHSGGKDSVLVTHIADDALGFKVPVVHTPKPTGVRNEVHPLTRDFLYELSAERTIYNIPDGDLRKFEKFRTQVDGTRAVEADRRDGRDVGLVVDGEVRSRKETPLYLAKGLFDQRFIYPIYDWTDLQVWTAIICYEIPYSHEYLIPSELLKNQDADFSATR